MTKSRHACRSQLADRSFLILCENWPEAFYHPIQRWQPSSS